MADTQKITIRNTDQGPRGINTVGGMVMIEPGASETVELSAGEAKSLPDYFKAGKATAKAPGGEGGQATAGPLDGSVNDVEAAVAKIDDVAELDRLIAAETGDGGKNRKGAVAALEARKEELSAGE